MDEKGLCERKNEETGERISERFRNCWRDEKGVSVTEEEYIFES